MGYLTINPDSTENKGTFKIKTDQNIYNFTLEFWIKCKFDDSTEIRNIFEMILLNTDNNEETVLFKIYNSIKDNRDSINDKYYTFELDEDTIEDVPVYKMNNKWSHIAIVFDQSTSFAVYLDGALVLAKNSIDITGILEFPFSEFKFHSYNKNIGYVYFYNINITKAIRYSQLISDMDDIMKSSTYGLKSGLSEETSTNVFKLDVNIDKDDEDMVLYLPFQEDLGVNKVTEEIVPMSSNTSVVALQALTSDDYYEMYDNNYDLQIAGVNNSSSAAAIFGYSLDGLADEEEWTLDLFYKNTNSNTNDFAKISDGANTSSTGYTWRIDNDQYLYINATNSLVSGSGSAGSKTSANFIHHSLCFNQKDGEKRYAYHRNGIFVTGKNNYTENTKPEIRSSSTFSSNIVTNLFIYFSGLNNKVCHVRFCKKCLYPYHNFDPTITMFKYPLDERRNGNNLKKVLSTEDNVALLYPISTNSPGEIYERGYSQIIAASLKSSNFQVEHDSTLDINWIKNDNYKINDISVPVIQSTSKHDSRNIIKFRNHFTENKSWTLEFDMWLEQNGNTTLKTLTELFIVSGFEEHLIVKVNGTGILATQKSTTYPYTTNILKLQTSAEQAITKRMSINRHNHFKLVSDIDNKTLTLFINDNQYYQEANRTFRYLHRLFFFTHDIDYPLKFSFTNIKVTMTAL